LYEHSYQDKATECPEFIAPDTCFVYGQWGRERGQGDKGTRGGGDKEMGRLGEGETRRRAILLQFDLISSNFQLPTPDPHLPTDLITSVYIN
jgi:hypothetical protein